MSKTLRVHTRVEEVKLDGGSWPLRLTLDPRILTHHRVETYVTFNFNNGSRTYKVVEVGPNTVELEIVTEQ